MVEGLSTLRLISISIAAQTKQRHRVGDFPMGKDYLDDRRRHGGVISRGRKRPRLVETERERAREASKRR